MALLEKTLGKPRAFSWDYKFGYNCITLTFLNCLKMLHLEIHSVFILKHMDKNGQTEISKAEANRTSFTWSRVLWDLFQDLMIDVYLVITK